MAALLQSVRSGTFLTQERLRLVPAALLLGYVMALAVLFATLRGLSAYHARPLGTDFSNVYAAGQAALHGDPRAPFDPARQYAEEQKLFGRSTPFYGWHYPPYFLLVATPLATLPYLGALALWQVATLAFYLAAIWMLLRAGPKPDVASNPGWLLLAAAFPATFVNLMNGNNGFLTAGLLAAGLACLESRPALAGVFFGLLVYKPQFAVMIPLALVAAGYWRTLAAAAATIAGLSAAVTALFGADIWSAFLASTHFTRTVVLEEGGTGFNKIQSVFAWTRLWGGSIALAYALQVLTSLAAALALTFVWRRRGALAERGAALSLAILLATPYCLDYDLVALAPAIALLAARGLEDGFRPYEKTLLAALWVVPIIARDIAGTILVPVGPMTLLAAGAFIAWHGLRRQAGNRIR
jgi:alpha-1,2-mannosyltransferase